MRTLFFVMLALLATGSASASSVSRAMDSSVIIYADYLDSDGHVQLDQAVCSGFVIRSDKAWEVIATARHCTRGLSDREVQFFDGDIGRIEGVMPSAYADVAVLYVHSRRHHPALPMTSKLDPGEPLFVVGMPSGNPWSYSAAHSRNGSLEYDVNGEPYITIESPGVYFGDSGGGVFTSSGAVVGVISSGGDPSYPNVVLCVPIGYAEELF
jgi:S1-C subfamily serine protease